MADKGKRRIWRRLLLSAGLVVLGGLLLMGIWQRNNLKSLWIAATSDQETIAQKREEQEEKRQDILDRYGISSLDDVEIPYNENGVDVGQLVDGEESGSGNTADGSETGGTAGSNSAETGSSRNSETGSGGNSGTGASDTSETGESAAIRQYVAALYALEDQYLEQLNQITEETKYEFWSLPKEEQTQANKLQIVRTKLSELLAAEDKCDQEVEMILGAIQSELDAQGSDSSLVAEIRTAYEESKATWKADCLTELYR